MKKIVLIPIIILLLSFLCMLPSVPAIPNAHANIVKTFYLNDGFESGTLNAMWSTTSPPDAVVQSSIKKNGNYALNLSNFVAVYNISSVYPFDTGCYLSFNWRSDFYELSYQPVFSISYSGNSGHLELFINNTAIIIENYVGGGVGVLTELNGSYLVNTWYNFTVYFQKDYASGNTNETFWIDGVVVANLVNSNTAIEPDDLIMFYGESPPYNTYIDDVEVYTTTVTYPTHIATVDSYQNVNYPNSALAKDGDSADFFSSSINSWMILDFGASYGNASCIEVGFQTSVSDSRISMSVSNDKMTWTSVCTNYYDGQFDMERAFTLSYPLKNPRYVKIEPYDYIYVDYVYLRDYPYVFDTGVYVYAQECVAVDNTHSSRFGSLGLGVSEKTSPLFEDFWLNQYDSIVYDYGATVTSSRIELVLGSSIGVGIPSIYVSSSPSGSWILAGTGYNFAYAGAFRYVNVTMLSSSERDILGLRVKGTFTPSYAFNVTITNMDCGNWLFSEDKAYSFKDVCSSSLGIGVYKIAFYDSQHWINVSYYATPNVWNLSSGSEYVNLQDGSISSSGYTTTIVFGLYLKSTILDSYNRSIYADGIYANGTAVGWEKVQTNYFNIYGLGGLNIMSTANAYAGRVTGGDTFELYSQSYSNVSVYQYWKNLKHVSFTVDLNISAWQYWNDGDLTSGSGNSYLDNTSARFGIDYWYQGGWVRGLWVQLTYPIKASTLTATKDSLSIKVQWFYKNVQIGTDEYVRGFVFFDQANKGTSGTCPMRIELWFNQANASSIMGGRVTSDYYAMYDSANWFAKIFTGGTWGIDSFNPPTSMKFAQLQDNASAIFSSQNLKLMKLYEELEQPACLHGFTSYLTHYTEYSIDKNSKTMQGIDTPAYNDPKTPNMVQGGLFSSFISFFNGLATGVNDFFKSIALGWIALYQAYVRFDWGSLSNMMDIFFGFIGWNHGFTALSTAVSSFTAFFPIFVQFFVSLAIYISSFFTNVFGQMVTYLVGFLSLFSSLYGMLVLIYGYMSPYVSWMPSVLVSILPLVYLFFAFWLFSPLLDHGDFHGVIDRFEMTIGTVFKLFGFVWRIGEYGFHLIWSLIQLIKGWL